MFACVVLVLMYGLVACMHAVNVCNMPQCHAVCACVCVCVCVCVCAWSHEMWTKNGARGAQLANGTRSLKLAWCAEITSDKGRQFSPPPAQFRLASVSKCISMKDVSKLHRPSPCLASCSHRWWISPCRTYQRPKCIFQVKLKPRAVLSFLSIAWVPFDKAHLFNMCSYGVQFLC